MKVFRSVFRRLRSRARTGILLEGAAVTAAALAAFVLLSFAADRSLRLEVGYRLVLLLMLVVALGRLVLARVLRPLGVDLTDEEMALAVERADPGLEQALISAVQFEDSLAGRRPVVESREMMSAVVEDVARRTAQLDTRRAVDGRRIARHGALLAAALLAGGAWVALAPDTARLWALRNLALSSVEWPRYTRLSFAHHGGALRVPEGDDLTVVVRAEGVVPEQGFLHYAFAGGESGVEAMTMTGADEFAFTLSSVLEDAELWATGGDGITPERLRVEVVERPRITDLQVTLAYPAYMAKDPARIAELEGDVHVPRGGVLRLSARSSKPLGSARATFAQESRVALELDRTGHVITGSFEPPDSGLLTINVVDRDRLDAARPPQLYLRLQEDRAPAVDFRPTGVGLTITPIARVPGALVVREDHGLTGLGAEFRVTDGAADEASEAPWRAAEVPGLDAFAPGATLFEQDVVFDLQPLHPGGDPAAEDSPLRPGQFLGLRFRARDNFGPGEPHVGESEAVVFQIVTREKLMEDLARRQGEQRRELELIVEREKASLSELREIVSPSADDPRAQAARLRVLTLARDQRTLGKRVGSVADHYRQILDEFLNNRIFEPANVAELRGRIQGPLERLAAEDFPASAASAQDFAHSGEEDVRAVAVLSYESIVERLEQVLGHMEEAESFATLLEGLRQTIKLQNSAMHEAEQRRGQEAESLFDPARGKTDPKRRDRENK